MLDDRKYARNKFIFNFAVVLDEDVEFSTYKSVVRKVAKLFKALEEQSGFLSNEVTRSGVYALIEQVMEDLNNYSECMIPISAFWFFPFFLGRGIDRLTRVGRQMKAIQSISSYFQPMLRRHQ